MTDTGTGTAAPNRKVRRLLQVGGAVIACTLVITSLIPRTTPLSLAAAAPTTSTTLPPTAEVGLAGTNTQLPPTNSAVTASGTGQFSHLKVTVNQTKNLVNQAVSITWTGGVPTDSAIGGAFNGQYFDNYVQIMQCWSPPQAASPTPQQCQFGGQPQGNPSVIPAEGSTSTGFWEANSRAVDSAAYPVHGAPPPPWVIQGYGSWWMPFQAVDATVIGASANPNAVPISAGSNGNGAQFWLNPYFSYNTTNEDAFAPTHQDGTGNELFTIDSGLEAPGLGCGQQSYRSGGTYVTPKCWLVIVPRGTPAQENAPGDKGDGVNTSPLIPTGAWQHRIDIPIELNPVGTACPIGVIATRFEGSELAYGAVSNWQPRLCSIPKLPPFDFASLSDDQARQQLLLGGTNMAVVTQPLASSTLNPAKPILYAPLTLSGVTIGFNIQRAANPDSPANEQTLQSIRVAHINLTPRLVAKLLTESYRDQFLNVTSFNSVYGADYPPFGYDWLKPNPFNLFSDPDFLQYNPEFRLLLLSSTGYDSGLVVEETRSDSAYELWRWVFADPAARAWLASKADPWGMTVNPYYSTDPNVNNNGTSYGTPIPLSFPKSDPYCFQNPLYALQGGGLARPLCMQDVFPFAGSMQSAAANARSTNIGQKTQFIGGANSNAAFTASGPQSIGRNLVLSITDSASAAQYGLQVASLSAAGDDSSQPSFVSPTSAHLAAAQAGMQPTSQPGVLQPNVSAKGTYPLATLSYAAASPATMTPPERGYFASLLNYAAGPGQVPGVLFGQLPAGYAPLSPALRAQTTKAAADIAAYGQVAPATTTTTPGGTVATTPVATNSSQPTQSTANGATTTPISSSPASGSPAVTSSAGRLPTVQLAIPASAGRTPGVAGGGWRFLVVVSLAIGVLSGFMARWVQVWRRRRANLGAVTHRG